jgi:hypothetical protein
MGGNPWKPRGFSLLYHIKPTAYTYTDDNFIDSFNDIQKHSPRHTKTVTIILYADTKQVWSMNI